MERMCSATTDSSVSAANSMCVDRILQLAQARTNFVVDINMRSGIVADDDNSKDVVGLNILQFAA